MIIAIGGHRRTQNIRMFVDGAHGSDQKYQKMNIVLWRTPRIKEIIAVIIRQRPVDMLTRTVDLGERFFMQQGRQTVLLGNIFKGVHDQLVVIHGKVGFFINRGNFVLAWRNLIVTCFGRDAKLEKLFFHIVHIGRYSFFDASEILIFQFLPLGGRCADYGPTAQYQILALIIIIHIYQEILLLRSQIGMDLFHVFSTQQFKHFDGTVAECADGAQQRRFLIQDLTGIGNESRGNAQRRGNAVALDKSGGRHIPGRITASLKCCTDTAGGERRCIRFTLHQLLSGKPFDHSAGSAGIGKCVMFFSRDSCHRLKPVCKMCCTLVECPLLHCMSDNIRCFGIQHFIFINCLH